MLEHQYSKQYSVPVHLRERDHLVIAGGGLAGLELGLAAQLEGMRVTIYEPGQYDRSLIATPWKKIDGKAFRPASWTAAGQYYPYSVGGLKGGDEQKEIQMMTDTLEVYIARQAISYYKETLKQMKSVQLVEGNPEMPLYLKELLSRMGPILEIKGILENPLLLNSGWEFTTFEVNPSAYMIGLHDDFIEKGKDTGSVIISKRIESLDELSELPHQFIADCTGVDQALFQDDDIEKIKGHLLFFPNSSDFNSAIAAKDLIMVPRGDIISVGAMFIRQGKLTDSEPTTQETEYLINGMNELLNLEHKNLKKYHTTLKEEDILGETTGFRPFRGGGPLVAFKDRNGIKVLQIKGLGGLGFTEAAGAAKFGIRLIKEKL